ncbi:hypothetical protein [Altererythrobacter aquiaggeris]|uniref:hypothetical protein n=1 Tax=Aestuarierythrobacter aquiaggeris TaxID=1898396 RepID=UPI0030171E49
MNTLEFTASLIASLAWPSAVVILGLSQREPISRLMGRVKTAKMFGAELGISDELEAIQVELEAARVPIGNAPELPPTEKSDAAKRLDQITEELSKTSATGTVMLSWLQLEEGLRDVAESNNVEWDPLMFWVNVTKLQHAGLMSRAAKNAIHSLRELRNRVANNSDAEVTLQEAKVFRDTISETLNQIRSHSAQS